MNFVFASFLLGAVFGNEFYSQLNQTGKIKSDVRESSVSRHNGSRIKGPP